jgi:hypothetical protein
MKMVYPFGFAQKDKTTINGTFSPTEAAHFECFVMQNVGVKSDTAISLGTGSADCQSVCARRHQRLLPQFVRHTCAGFRHMAAEVNLFMGGSSSPGERLGSSNSVAFSVPLKIRLPRISRYLGSLGRGLKLL